MKNLKTLTALILFLVALSLTNFVSALNVKSSAENNIIIPELNHPARFELTITTSESGNYNIYTLTEVNIRPSSPFQLDAGTNKVDIYIYPTDQLTQRGFYTFSYNIGQQKEKLTVKLLDLEDIISISSDTIKPGDGKIKFYVENKEGIKIDKLTAKFSSILFEDVERTFSLKPFEKTYLEIDVDDKELKTTQAGSYVIAGKFETEKGTKTIKGKIYIDEKKGITTQKDKSGFLITTQTITKINSGNVNENIKISMQKNIFSRLFTTPNPEPTSIQRDGFTITYNWNEQLSPSETFTAKTKTNYIFPLLIIIFAALVVWGFIKYTTTKVEVKKSVSHVKTKGGEFALKVKLSVKAKKDVENVNLVDKIPDVVKIYKKFGTQKPDKIDTKNRRIQWNLGDLKSGEQRYFSYIVYSTIGVFGKFSLPPATSVFELDNEIHEVESNTVYFLAEQTKKDE